MVKKGDAVENAKKINRVLGILSHNIPWQGMLKVINEHKYTLISDEIATQALQKDQERYMQQWECEIDNCLAHGVLLRDADTKKVNELMLDLKAFKPALIGEITHMIPKEALI
jgi:hypothetical protein